MREEVETQFFSLGGGVGDLDDRSSTLQCEDSPTLATANLRKYPRGSIVMRTLINFSERRVRRDRRLGREHAVEDGLGTGRALFLIAEYVETNGFAEGTEHKALQGVSDGEV